MSVAMPAGTAVRAARAVGRGSAVYALVRIADIWA